MKKLKKWTETALIVMLVSIVIAFLLPLYGAVVVINVTFAVARGLWNIFGAGMIISAVSYGGYLLRTGGATNAYDGKLMPTMALALFGVGLWDIAAWWLWRQRPEWREAIQLDEESLPGGGTHPKRMPGWISRCWRVIDRIMTVAVSGILLGILVVGPLCFGTKGLAVIVGAMVTLGTLVIIGALAWPVVVFLGWLPRCRKRKFGEFFCAATRNPEVVVFGKKIERDDAGKEPTSIESGDDPESQK